MVAVLKPHGLLIQELYKIITPIDIKIREYKLSCTNDNLTLYQYKALNYYVDNLEDIKMYIQEKIKRVIDEN